MNRKFYCFILMLLITAAGILKADHSEKKKAENLIKIDTNVTFTYFNINNISTVFANNGISDYSPETKAAFEFPKGNGKYVFFTSGLVWGAKILDNPGTQSFRVGGATYYGGLIPGKIDYSGYPTTENDPANRIYRVRPDVFDSQADYSSEVNDENKSKEEIIIQYQKNWYEWPGQLGAPYKDVDNNGSYDPNIDVPGVEEADQTIWFVSNDLDERATVSLYGSLPIGLEVQTTVWGYKRDGALDNTLFRKYTLINKGGIANGKTFASALDSVYICMWSDPDLGNGMDDFVGCDTTMNIGFVYNGDSYDDGVYEYDIPAGGFVLLQGPNTNEKHNLLMTSFYISINGDDQFPDPILGDFEGTLQFRRLFEGKASTTGEFFKDPITSLSTKFLLSGDPLKDNGWVDGMVNAPGDRRFGLVSGPFKMAIGDTQEIVVAQIAAGATGGDSRLESVSLLKDYSREVQKAYEDLYIGIESDDISIPKFYKLSQNYPNPFNPATTISFAIPKEGNVKITVYDMLGREIEVLTNKEYSIGAHKIEWNASRYSSGVYFYRLESAGFILAKKMLLIK